MAEGVEITNVNSGQVETAKIIPLIETETFKSESFKGSLLDEYIEYADTSYIESIIQKRQLRKYQENYTKELLRILFEQDFEYGFDSQADRFIKNLLHQNHAMTREWLNSVFIEYFYDRRILIGLLQVLSHMDYSEISPEGPTMAVAALSHVDAEVRECGIRAFENWSNINSLGVLKNLKCSEEWLQEYVRQVISDLEEELACHDFSH